MQNDSEQVATKVALDGAELLAALKSPAQADNGKAHCERQERREAPLDEDMEEGTFNRSAWEPTDNRYGLSGLLICREKMLPIEKPDAVSGLKFLICPGYSAEEPGADEKKNESQRSGNRDHKSKGKGKGKKDSGRFVPEMGRAEPLPGYQKGMWWRNIASNELDVIVREAFSLMSGEIWKVPFGHYVQQAGPVEVFVSGQAQGLQRMPVFPRGWVTVDASAVGGPKYLDTVKAPRWKVSFKTDQLKGDILVRESVSLESDEVGFILYGTYVHQVMPQETLEDGIIRMKISFPESSSTSEGGERKLAQGWVTCDASSQGGPKFFTACPEEEEPAPAAPEASDDATNSQSQQGQRSEKDREKEKEKRDGQNTSWEKNRVWKVTNLEPSAQRSLPIVSRAEPFAPGTGRIPPEDIVVRWLSNGEIMEQVGHSKKTRGYMVMPVRMITDANGEQLKDVQGWVTRRLVDKQKEKEGAEGAWLVEVADDGDDDRDRRRAQRRERAEKAAQAQS